MLQNNLFLKQMKINITCLQVISLQKKMKLTIKLTLKFTNI